MPSFGNRWPTLTLPICLAACAPDLDTTRQVAPRGDTLGAIIYQEACQRVAYVAEVEEGRPQVDVSGQKYRATCVMNAPAPPDAPIKLVALQGQRPVLVSALDRLLPEDLQSPTRLFLTSLAPAYDDGTMEDVIGRLADVLGRAQADAELAPALVRLQPRAGYRPLPAAGGLLPVLVSYPRLGETLDRTLDLIGENGRAATERRALLDALAYEARSIERPAQPEDPERSLRMVRDLLFTPTADNGDGRPRLLVRRDHRGVATFRAGVPAPLVDQDTDGLADLDTAGRFVDATGAPVQLGTPFPAPGTPATTDPQPRDAQGRLLGPNGQPLYADVDLDPSLLGALVRELPALTTPQDDTLFSLLYGAGALLGPRVPQTRSYTDESGQTQRLSYQGFDTDNAPLLDLGHAFVQLLGAPRIDEVLRTTRTLLGPQEDATARVLAALLDVNERGRGHPEATIPPTSNLYDDLVPIIVRVLRVPGLVDDLLVALQDPHVRGLGAMLSYQMRYRDRFVLDQNSRTVTGAWQTQVDRTRPDSDFNRSLLQRMAHLIHDANGVQFCNREGARLAIGPIPITTYRQCEMFRVDDLGLFYVLAMADHAVTSSSFARTNRYQTTYSKASFREAIQNATLRAFLPDSTTSDSLLESSLLIGIDGFTRFPTPEALNRSLFLDPAHQTSFVNNSIDPVRCRDGDPFIDVHNDSIFAWERPIPQNPSGFATDNFYQAVGPLITAFARHDECLVRDGQGTCTEAQNAAKIFLDLVSVLHEYWATPDSRYSNYAYQKQNPNAARYATGDGVVRYEPLVAEVLGQSDLVPALIQLSGALPTLTVDGTPPGTSPLALPVLLGAASYVFDPTRVPAGLTYRDGRTTALKSDGVSPAGRVTPYYLLADAYARRRTALAAAPPDQAGAWRSATSHLVDELLTVEAVNGRRRLKNRRLRGVTLALVDFLGARIQAHRAAGDLTPWIQQRLTADLGGTLQGPVPAALVDLTTRLEEDPRARDALYGVLGHLAGAGDDARFTAVLTALGDAVQVLLDDRNLVPVLRFAGNALAADRGAVDAQLRLADRARRLDPSCLAGSECVLVALLRNLFASPSPGPGPAPDPGYSRPTPASDLADGIGEVHRARPGAGGDFDAADYRSVLDQLRIFFSDERRGFPRFVDIVKGRRG
jgi:hypothetical protein